MQDRKPPHSSLLRRKSMLTPWTGSLIICALILTAMLLGMNQASKDKDRLEATIFYGSTTPTTSEGRHIP